MRSSRFGTSTWCRASCLSAKAEAVVKGDSKIPEIAAASIIAKVFRDDLMIRLHEEHPGYGWDKNKGYGSPMHLRGLETSGVTVHHRPTFAPVAKALALQADQRPA